MELQQLISLLGDEADSLLNHTCQKISRERIQVPQGNHVDTVFESSDRPQGVKDKLRWLYGHGRLGGTGYLSIFPVDQGIEHTAAVSFYRQPEYFNPETIVRMAIEGGTNGVAATYGVLSLMARKYAPHIPFILKLNHNELLTYPNKHDQVMFATVKQAAEIGCAGVGATIYFGSEESNRQLQEVRDAFALAHEYGMFTILWCYPRNPAFSEGSVDVNSAIDISSQACHLGVTLGADIIKQKLPTPEHGFEMLHFGKYSPEMYEALLTEHPIDLVRYQVAHCYMGKISLLSSGGESLGDDDLREAVRTAVISKRGGGAGLIAGRKIFNKPFAEGVELLHAIQDVYLMPEVTVA
jgi:fructose-bisphosphate aldolase, class I